MQITVFGASGQVGRLVVEEALSRGHSVVAFRHSHGLEERANLSVVRGDARDGKDVAKALVGSDAVISALGSWGTKSKDILTIGTKNIIPTMEVYGVKRIISLTGHGASAPGDKFDLIHEVSRFILKLLAAKILKDGEDHIKLLNRSRLDWTVVRSPVMTKFGEPQKFDVATNRPWPLATINRQSVAICLVDLVETKQYNRQAPFITKN